MKLIADSGSTKTDWLFMEQDGGQFRLQTLGINPFFRSTNGIVTELRPVFATVNKQVDEVFFYGAGIVNAEKASVIEQALHQLFGEVPCHFFSDVVGAARASCGHEAGIACILGTGSNACYYDGGNVIVNIPPMGFIIGDEGSGAVMGRNLLSDYFKFVMPEELRLKFTARFQLTKDDVLNNVYKQSGANKYLAQFSVFLSEEITHEYCREFVEMNLRAFVVRNVKMLPKADTLPINFIGSVADAFQTILLDLLDKEHLISGKIMKEPILGLADFHLV